MSRVRPTTLRAAQPAPAQATHRSTSPTRWANSARSTISRLFRFVAGSLLPHLKGHNPIGFAKLGSAIITGPYVESFQDLFAEMLAAGGARVADVETCDGSRKPLARNPRAPSNWKRRVITAQAQTPLRARSTPSWRLRWRPERRKAPPMRPPSSGKPKSTVAMVVVLMALLTPVSWAYAAIAAHRQRTTISRHAPVPVVCIGTSTVGGAGKTPISRAIRAKLGQHAHTLAAMAARHRPTARHA